jgi:hypothetical protein
MPASVNVSRSARSPLRFCQSVLFVSFKAAWKSPLTSLGTALFLAISCAIAGAQTATTTTLAMSPASAANGSVFTLTASVNDGTTALTGGTVTFRDTYNSITQVLGVVQVQSAHGTAGNAVLCLELGGIGTHSIVATFNATKANSTSSSGSQSVTLTGLYPTVASLVQTGGTTGNFSLTTTIVGVGSLNLSPTGSVSLLDTSNSNWPLGAGSLGAGTFGQQTVTAAGSPITVGNNPQDVAAGDFNGDGNIDLAVLNSNDDTISILIGDGTGGFTQLTTKPSTGNGPVAIVAGDFNGDGKLDLAVANSTDQTVWIWLGNGDGTFNGNNSYSVALLATSLTALAVGDFNGDGIPDFAVLGSIAAGGAVDILQGDGTGAFANVTSSGIAVGNGPSALVTGDFNGDGNLDFAVANLSDNTISVMKGDGSGATFAAFSLSPFSTGTGTSPAALATGDFNGDGNLDLAVAETAKTGSISSKGTATGPSRCCQVLLSLERSPRLSSPEILTRTASSTLRSRTSRTTRRQSCWARARARYLRRPAPLPLGQALERPLRLRSWQQTLTATAPRTWQSSTATRTM